MRRFGRVPILLSVIILVAAFARGYGLNFPTYHWDENFDFGNVFVASYYRLQLSTYVHGSLIQYLFLGAWSALALLKGMLPTTQNLLALYAQDPMPFVLAARGLLALAGTANVFLVYLLGRRLYNEKAGIIAAFLLALDFLHASESHYARGHVLATFLITIAVYFCARILQDRRTRDYVLAGVSIGLAASAQYSAILAMAPLIIAHLARTRGTWRSGIFRRELLIGMDSAGIAFFAAMPYALLEFPFFAGEMKWFLSEAVSHPWVSSEGQPIWLFYLTEHLRNGMGIGVEILAFAGVAYAFYRHTRQDWVLLSFPLLLSITVAKGPNFARYALPLLPFLMIAAACLVADAWEWAEAKYGRAWVPPAFAAIMIGLQIPSAVSIARYDYYVSQPDTRAVAAEWMRLNLPVEAAVTIEGAGVLGPTVPNSRKQIDEELARIASAATRPESSYRQLTVQAMQYRPGSERGLRVQSVFRLDQIQEGGTLVGMVASVSDYAEREVDYLVSVDWMQNDAEARYAPAFNESLDIVYERMMEFSPTIHFSFDPYAWRMDYDALGQVIIGKPEVGGPHLTLYRRRGADHSANSN